MGYSAVAGSGIRIHGKGVDQDRSGDGVVFGDCIKEALEGKKDAVVDKPFMVRCLA